MWTVTVVADKKMVDYYSNEDLTTYILTVMNMVSSVFHDASIGNAVNIYVVRIILLEDDQHEALEISHNADDTLRSFCQWQQMINPGNETHPHHHDVAVLLTRYNICSRVSDWCATLGVSEIAGMCQPLRSCNVNEDTGLQISYTIAHELGHNFGMNHDGPQNGCEVQDGTSQHVMSPHLTNDAKMITWSNCSRKEITHFLDRNWGTCLEDEPPTVEYRFPELPPGAMYDADHQCRLSYGQEATHCSDIEGMERVCQTLWCRINNRCITRMDPAAEGTHCGKHKWCSAGECVTMGEQPAAIHGNWGSWSSWSSCTRTCGAGVAVAVRHCDNPSPAYGGRYCTGDRKRYRICNTQECPENGISFRAVQCSQHGEQPYKGENRTWLPVLYQSSPCQLDCKPDNEFYSVKLLDSVVDGTPCKPGTKNMCINGRCKRVACDWTIDGEAQEDRCGQCHGDGTQCVTNRGVFNQTIGSGYVEAVTFPKEARNVKLHDLHDAANYLAIKDTNTGEYYLNGDWVIHWSGEYSANGIMMYYDRDGETESLLLPGPLKTPLTFMLLFQTENPGVSWEYTLPHANATYIPSFSWRHTEWSICSVTCGSGTQVSRVQCMEQEAGLVEDRYCSSQTRPKDRSRTCNTHACPAWWWSGPWQSCSVTCGAGGIRRRTVICVRSFGPTEQMALLDSACDQSGKPHETEACPSQAPCVQLLEWKVGPWSKSCGQDPCEYEEREVECVAPSGTCDPLSQPPYRRQCGNITCGTWQAGNWSKCSAPCGEGVQFRRVWCEGGLACREKDEPRSVRECTGNCLEEDTHLEIHEVLSEDPFTAHSSSLATDSTTSTTTPTTSSTTSLTTTTSPTSTSTTSQTSTSTTSVTTSLSSTTASATTSTVLPPTSTILPSTTTTTSPTSTQSIITSSTTSPPPSPSTATTSPLLPSTTSDSVSIIQAISSPTPHDQSTATTSMPPSTIPDATPTSTTTPLTITPPPTTTEEIKSHPTPFPTNDDPFNSTFTSALPLDLSTDSVATVLPTTQPSTTVSHSKDKTSAATEASLTQGLATSSSVSPPPALAPPSTPTEATTDHTSWPTRVPHPLDPDTPDSAELIPPSPDATHQEEAATISEGAGEQDATRTPAGEINNGTVTPEEVSSITPTPDGALGGVQLESKESPSPSEPPRSSHVISETLNEIDLDSKPQVSKDKTLPDLKSYQGDDATHPQVTSASEDHHKPMPSSTPVTTEKTKIIDHFSNEKVATETEAPVGVAPPTKQTEQTTPEELATEGPLSRTEQPTVLEEPVKKKHIEEEAEATMVEEPLRDVTPDNDTDAQEEERPQGIAVDKIDVEDFEVIEIVELPAKGKKKKMRKKVLLHTGVEAVDALHNLAEETASHATPAPMPDTAGNTIVPQHRWSFGSWSECTVECGGGSREREVVCEAVTNTTTSIVDASLCPRPRPSSLQPCNTEECGEWVAGNWGECSAKCGTGERVRDVHCPKDLLCPASEQPYEVEPCNPEPCVQWVVGPWSLCTRQCGGGYQIRHVKCVDVRTQEASKACVREERPKHKMACHNQRCPKNRRGQQRRCRDRLDTKLCRRLKHMCTTKFFLVKCCRTCLRRPG
ncbi:A disintegrin and metalloproteinase with thrombospondin motifs 7-like isoform X1 [Scylla paramamosain]|uniref:A disintegrin and metalloproteinase with thrombospondin motifs 7-like isoform X1 n=1 Tax=Scylla paramamosain TaxID=85552 RepID=UPI0030830020